MLHTIVEIKRTGRVISSGVNEKISIKHFKHTACVNDSDELSIGSVCANAVEITFFDIDGELDIAAGDEIHVERYDVDGDSYYEIFGLFTVDQPARPTANTLKIVGYDNVIKLDTDLTDWLNSLKGWPYPVKTFAPMVANKCGLVFNADWSNTPNANYQIHKFSYTGVTGRMLIRWLGEICARYCYADENGDLRFGWYEDSGITISAKGARYYFENSFSFEDYETAKINAMQLQLADSDGGILWPQQQEGSNSYVIRGNAILQAQITIDTSLALSSILEAIGNDTYTPCKVATPSSVDLNVGHKVNIVDKNGRNIKAYVMTRITDGQKDTLECTGSPRRDAIKNINNRKPVTQAQASNSVQMASFSGGGRGIIFRKSDGAEAGRFGIRGDELVFSCPKDAASGEVITYPLVWRTITLTDSSGQPYTLKVLAQG